MEAIEKISV